MSFIEDYAKPSLLDNRTALRIGMPKLVHLYIDLNDNKVRKFLPRLNGRIVDLGCGDGRFLAYADVGVDLSIGMLRRAKMKKLNKSLVEASVTHLPFRDKAFNHAFMIDVLIHVKPRENEEFVKPWD